jgi:hypothetical protein
MTDDDKDCADGSVWERIGCIISYDKGPVDITINYILLVFNLWYQLRLLDQYLTLVQASESKRKKFYRYALESLISIVVFQIGLCLLVNCIGISIIWCAMAGFGMSERRRVLALFQPSASSSSSSDNPPIPVPDPTLAPPFTTITIMNVAAIIYYIVVQDALTTVAHILALILGAVMSKVGMRIQEQQEQSSNYIIIPGSEEEEQAPDNNRDQTTASSTPLLST